MPDRQAGVEMKAVLRSGWTVEQGPAKKVGIALEKEPSEVLAFVVRGEDEATVRTKFGVLKRVAEMLPDIYQKRRVRNWDALVEALTPDIQLFSPTKIAEAEMLSRARVAVLKSNEFVTAAAIAKGADYSVKNPSSQPNRWKRDGRIFAITHKGVDYYPMYALNPQDAYHPFAIMKDVLSVFAGQKDGWGAAFWFGSLNGHLGNRKPKELLRSDPKSVLKAAKLEAIGGQHG
jgi:hypothetical protein